jgi:sulfatase modifying factor 1
MNASVSLAQGRGTWPVGQKAPNELGIFDMSGNVWEWLWDAYGGFERQITGGSWNHSAARALFSDSDGDRADFRATAHGFRLARNVIGDMVTVQGGTLPQGSGLAGQTVGTFQIARTEVTWGEWKTVRAWAVSNGYTDLENVGAGSGDNHPVRNVNWYDVVKWCNAKSEMEGLKQAYLVNGVVYKSGDFGADGTGLVSQSDSANGYRLPAEVEWEWAARGGLSSNGYTYSGSNNLDDVGWWFGNSKGAEVVVFDGGGTWPAGQKSPNELGIYDMSGNVLEWCSDLILNTNRRLRGGGWRDDNIATMALLFRDGINSVNANNPGARVYQHQACGFRLARNAPSTHSTDTFGTGNNTFDLEFVSIGNPMNAADPDTNLGAVSYPYRISKYSISQKVWDAAVANGLQNAASDTRHDAIGLIAGENTPTNNVSWYEAAVFVNWLNTSKGYQPAYNLTFSNGAWSMQLWSNEDSWSNGGLNRYRHKNAHYFLPSDNEWYKAAYYDPNKTDAAGYWMYSTGSDMPPEQVSNTGTGKGGAGWNYGGAGTDPGTTVYGLASWSAPADVNACGGLSPYGTMGQGGNVAQWIETSSNGLNSDPQANRRAMGYSYSWWGTVSAREDNGLSNLQPQLDVGGAVGIRVASKKD